MHSNTDPSNVNETEHGNNPNSLRRLIDFINEKLGPAWVIILLPVIVILILILSAIGLSISSLGAVDALEGLNVGNP